MRKPMRAVTAGMTVALAVSLTGCGYNTFEPTDEQVMADWAEVINRGFRDLSAQLEGAENRTAAARNGSIQAVQDHNVTVRSFPSILTAMVFGCKEKPTFAVENEKEIAKPPSVGFGTAPAKPAGPESGASK